MLVEEYRSLLKLDDTFTKREPLNNEQYKKAIVDSVTYLTKEYEERNGSSIVDLNLHSLPISSLRIIISELLTIRMPSENEDEHLFRNIDSILATELQSKTISAADTFQSTLCVHSHKMTLFQGDITCIKADFIVNAANTGLLGCFQPTHKCIDNVIHSAAGPRLRQDCYTLIREFNYQETEGNAIITRAYSLPSTYVIHTVGPRIDQNRRNTTPTKEEQEILASCYISCLSNAKKIKPSNTSIVFCCISTGLFGFPQKLASEVAFKTVHQWLQSTSDIVNWNVVFNVFTNTDEEIYKKLFSLEGRVPIVNKVGNEEKYEKAKSLINNAQFLIISGGAGLSAAVGLDYTSEEVFKKHHPAMHKRGFKNMYQFIGYTDWTDELKWGYLFRQTNLARFTWPQSELYQSLKRLMMNKFGKENSFVLTSNADGMFEQNGFPADRIYTIQGDYSRIQCLRPCTPNSVWPSKDYVDAGLLFIDEKTNELTNPKLIPTCPKCAGPMFLNVRGGNWFIESIHHKQRDEYRKFLQHVKSQIQNNNASLVILEIGAGFNTPGVLRIPNEQLAELDHVHLIRVNYDHESVPVGCFGSIGLRGDAKEIVSKILP